MDFTTAAWIWLYIGAFLMLAEIVSPGFVVFFFGLGASTVAGAKWLFPEMPVSGQLALFSIFSIVYLVTLRRYIKSIFFGGESRSLGSEYAGRLAKVTVEIRPDVPGRVLLGDAEWQASASVRIEPDAEVRVTGRDNLTLKVEKI